MNVQLYMYMYMHMCMYMYLYMYSDMYIRRHTHADSYMSRCICMRACVFVYVHAYCTCTNTHTRTGMLAYQSSFGAALQKRCMCVQRTCGICLQELPVASLAPKTEGRILPASTTSAGRSFLACASPACQLAVFEGSLALSLSLSPSLSLCLSLHLFLSLSASPLHSLHLSSSILSLHFSSFILFIPFIWNSLLRMLSCCRATCSA